MKLFQVAKILVVSSLFFSSLTGCSLMAAYEQRQAIQQSKFSLRSVSLGGIDLAGVGLVITLELENPTNTPIVLDRLDYTLYVANLRALAGATEGQVTVPPKELRTVPIRAYVRYRDVSEQVRSIWLRGVNPTYRLEGVGHFETPFGTIDYPIDLRSASS